MKQVLNNTYKSEIEIADNRIFLTIEATLTPEDEKKLRDAGWVMLSTGARLDCDGTPAYYLCNVLYK